MKQFGNKLAIVKYLERHEEIISTVVGCFSKVVITLNPAVTVILKHCYL